MKQTYHRNAITNVNNRSIIKNSSDSISTLSKRFGTSTKTISKWKNRDDLQDKSSAPHIIKYALSNVQKVLIKAVRTATWLPLDEVHEIVSTDHKSITRSAVYRLFISENINIVPQEKKDKAKQFKAYKPGYLHIDVTYLPKLDGENSYLYVAIDRASRTMFFAVYANKTAENTGLFFDECIRFFRKLCEKPSILDDKCNENNIEHRCTKPATPQTNGMVERANGTIKNNTILMHTYQSKNEMTEDLTAFLCYYNLYRRHGSLQKELGDSTTKVKTPMDAIEKWYQLNPEIFKVNPAIFKQNLINLQQQNIQVLGTTL